MRPTKATLRSARSAGTLTQLQYEVAVLALVRKLPAPRVSELTRGPGRSALSDQQVEEMIKEVLASLKG